MNRRYARGSAATFVVGVLALGCVTVGPASNVSPSPSDKPASSDVAVATSVPATAGATRKPRRSREPATVAPTSPPTSAATDAPTTSPTEAPSEAPTAAPTLNFSLPAVHGSTAKSSGFVPDPFSVAATGGGPVNVSYLGSGCTGYATSAPTFSFNYTAGSFPTLRFYFVGGADTTMIINTPGASYVCVDDSFGTLNPTIDFNSPAGGRYDIWIGTFAEGQSVAGTLYATENTGNHP